MLLYTNSELSEKEIKKLYVFTVIQKKNKKPRNIFNQEVENLHTEERNYKDMIHSWIGKILLKCP